MLNKKFAEIKGIGFPNRGAELLLVACIDRLHKQGFAVATEPYSPYHYKVNYPLYTKISIRRFNINLLQPLSLLPNYILERLGFIRASEISLVLDASGYAYGDPWPASLANQRLLGENLKCPVYMLPQSLGPFSNAEAKNVASKITKKATRIFAREEKGRQNIKQATGINVKVVPDITFCLDPPESEWEGDVIMIPNFQVYNRRGGEYIECLVSVISELNRQGRSITVLNHEGYKDHAIYERIVKSLDAGRDVVNYIEPKDGLEAKGIIAKANFVITSRYHGLISALSSSVPCVPLGWSFKYDEAMNLFDIYIPDLIADPEKVSEYVEDEEYKQLFSSEEYSLNLSNVKRRVNLMWDEIFSPRSDAKS